MIESSVRIKITSKKGNRVFKIKEFPVFLGSGNAPDIIPIKSDKVEAKHGKLYTEKGKLYYEDNSNSGTKINSKLIRNEKILLSPGINDFQLGRLRVLVENNFPIENGGSKSIYYYILGIMVLALLLVAGWLIYANYSSYNSIKFSSFSLTPTPLVSSKENKIDSLYLDKKVDFTKIKYTLFFIQDKKVLDSLNISSATQSFYIPTKLINKDSVIQQYYIELKPISNEYSFIPKSIKSKYFISNKEQFETKNGFNVRTTLSGNRLEYEILSGLKNIKKITPNFGNGIKINNMKKMEKLSLTYDKSGEYIFKLLIVSKNNKKTEFKRTIYIP